MKNTSLNLFYLFHILLIFISCDCQKCPNNLESYFDGTPYKDSDTLIYISDNLAIQKHKVEINYNPPEDEYCDSGKETTMNCGGSMKISIGQLVILLIQEPNYLHNDITKSHYFNYFKNNSYYHSYFSIKDSVEYEIDDKTFQTEHYVMNDTSKLEISNYYYDFLITKDLLILEYTEVNSNTHKRWRLKL